MRARNELIAELALRLGVATKAVKEGCVEANLSEIITRAIDSIHQEGMILRGIKVDRRRNERKLECIRQIKAKRRAAGLCVRCGRPKSDDGYLTCEKCRAKAREREKRRKMTA